MHLTSAAREPFLCLPKNVISVVIVFCLGHKRDAQLHRLISVKNAMAISMAEEATKTFGK